MGHLARLALALALAVPFSSGSPYNDCSRLGPPDPGTVPSWDGSSTSFFDDYRPLADIHRFVDQLQAAHPGLITLKEIGKSWEGRPLRVMEITGQGDSLSKPVIFIQGGIHSREWIATAAVLYLAYSLVEKATAEAGSGVVTTALQQYVFSILVPANPDGYVYTWQSVRMWRKTRSNREHCSTAADGVAGVDANRNWGYTRGMTITGGETTSDLVDVCVETFEGPKAFSEPETLAVATYLRQRQNSSFSHSVKDILGHLTPGPGYVTAFLDYHSYAMQILPPWGYSAKWPAAPDDGYMRGLCNSMAAAIRKSSGQIFSVGPDLLPADPGTAPDWAYGELGIRSTMTVELEGHETNSSFCISKERIKPVGREQFQGLLALVNFLRTHGDQPSKLFGLFVGTPPPPQRLWAVTERQQVAPQGFSLAAVAAFAVAISISIASMAILAFQRHRQLHRNQGSRDCDGLE